ncbi:tyrosine-protein phosphatase [Arthrobacter sp. Bz4]|uniref:tyrosine-protein phosphatase n=1 Tax=Arthrobacter sp. Bz4 TaxID=2171979 RepID=UPI00105736BA|nr:tyrosine-protein phosphatase [Arthrobacter sp. Bz4]
MTSQPGHTADPAAAEARAVRWDGAVNARDLGGLGGVILPGRMYRMGRHEWLSSTGWRQAYDDGVRTVVDLRNPGEFGRRPGDPAVAADTLTRFTIVNRPTEDQSDADFMELVGPYLSSPEHYRENLRRWPEKIAAVVQTVIDAPDGGVIIHCSAGRDRTGMVTAVMLSAAGVSADEIVQDYALGVRGINQFFATQETPKEPPASKDELQKRLDRSAAHLHQLLSQLDAAQYLLDAGLTPSAVAALRNRLTSGA